MLPSTAFVNRDRETQFLQQVLASSGAELILVYGRRRVGKTALLLHVAERAPLPVLYHVAAQTTRAEELARLSARMADFFDDELLRVQPLRTWESVWLYLGQRAERAFGVILDEFPYAVEGDPALPSLLQHEWDRRLQTSRIKLILCGSSISMMERLGLSQSSPLYGRRTGQWRVLPFDPEQFALLWPASDLAELLATYCVTGGNPHYAKRLDPRLSLLENIRAHILTRGSMLYDEVPFLLREEVRDPRVYQAILAAVAGGAHKFSELSSKTGLDKAHLTRYLAILSDLGIMQREVPVTEAHPEKSRRGLYRIADPFVAFWYRFVYANRDRLESGETTQVLRESVEPALDDYIARAVEPHLGTLFRSRWRHLVPFEPAFSGRYWNGQHEIDWLILDRTRSRAVAVEVKWTRRPVSAPRLIKELRTKVGAISPLRELTVTYVLVSRAGFREAKTAGSEALVSLREPNRDRAAARRDTA